MIIKAYAKINIGLKIINKREDGFHNLETVFYPVKLFDELKVNVTVSKRNTNSVMIKTNNKIIPTDRTNICFKAVQAFFKEFKIKDYFIINININKSIPVGGGLGGGSSDAAAVLKYLVKYFNINIEDTKNEILNIALYVGSDVPFFLILKPCFAQKRGEKISRLYDFNLDNYNILLVNPNLHVSTKWAFENLNYNIGEMHDSKIKDVKIFNSESVKLLENDFEKIVFERYPELENIKNELINFSAVFSSMSGSGATMYGLFDKNDNDSLKKAYEYYKSKNYFVFIS